MSVCAEPEPFYREILNLFLLQYPLRHGLVEDWDLMERFMSRCIYKNLRADPEEHFFMLTEPPLNTPENREYLAEMMFESFNVPGMSIQVQVRRPIGSIIREKRQLAQKHRV